MQLSDGRWRASGPEKYTFTEADESVAVARFLQWKSQEEGTKDDFVVPVARVSGMENLQAFLKGDSKKPYQIEVDVGPGGEPKFTVNRAVDEAQFWADLRQLIITQPQYVAEMTGIEAIGYLNELKKREPSPTLEEVCRLYLSKPKLSPNWRAKSKQFWKEFVETVNVRTLREVTQDHLIEYGDMVLDAGETPTYARQRFGAIKSIINYPSKRGKWAEDVKRALAFCSVLVPPKKSATDPRPIDPADFRALLDKSDPQMKAILLLALNCCMYAAEVAVLNWSDIDLNKGTLVTQRSKTGIVRIATLWPETIEALKTLTQNGEAIFRTEAGTQADYLCIYRLFKIVRGAAEREKIQFSQIRDSSYTAAVESGTDINTCRLLGGHATGISDAYIRRRPAMVQAACDGIRRHYFSN
jgi:integrase